MTGIHVRPDDGTHYPMVDGDHIAKAAVPGAFEVFEVLAEAGPPAPPHVAPWTGVLYLLDGALTVSVESVTYEVEPGDLVTMPSGTPCTFAVRGGSARFLAITSGDAASGFFADFADSVGREPPTPESMAAVVAVTARHGVSLAAP